MAKSDPSTTRDQDDPLASSSPSTYYSVNSYLRPSRSKDGPQLQLANVPHHTHGVLYYTE